MGLIVLALLALVAFGVTGSGSSDSRSGSEYEDNIAEALRISELNESLTDSAPQQQVANGWVARDLLAIIAQENAEQIDLLREQSSDSQRLGILLLLGVLAIVWLGLTAESLEELELLLRTEGAAESVEDG